MAEKSNRLIHIVGLVLALGLSFCFLFALRDADKSITMPLIKPQQEADENLLQAQKIDELIGTIIFPITLDQKENVLLIREQYDNADDVVKQKVTTLKQLEEAEKQISLLEDKEQAKKVIDMINGLTDDYEYLSLRAAREAYENLNEQQKSYVTNLFILENAEKEIQTIVTKDNLKIGDTVVFNGGNVYYSSYNTYVANRVGYSLCRVTNIAANNLHPYHLVSIDGGGVYGWVDIVDMSRE
ncbi:MAG: hypothetical protein Q4C64_04905 [Erysipelotrichia bacterium]|nr:hypothetical protein [Erysipelotrichia bacterium]